MARPATIKPEQVASELQISMRTFYRRVKDGSIPAFKMGSLWRCPASYIENFRANMGVDMAAAAAPPRATDDQQAQGPAPSTYAM